MMREITKILLFPITAVLIGSYFIIIKLHTWISGLVWTVRLWIAGKRQRRPPPISRRRRVSDLTQCPNPMVKDRNRRSSTFLRLLPLELRHQIYAEYYEDSTFMVDTSMAQHEWKFSVRATTDDRNNMRYFHPATPGGKPVYHVQKGLLELPLTCRQIYSESIDFMYSHNTFKSIYPGEFSSLAKTLLPQRFNAITSMQMNFAYCHLLEKVGINDRIYKKDVWEKEWRLLASMPRLKRMQVRMFGSGRRNGRPMGADMPDAEVGDSVFEPMMECRALDEFEVEVAWQIYEPARWNPAPFRLTWRDASTGELRCNR